MIESLASTVMSRIEDVLYADSLTKNQSSVKSNGRTSNVSSPITISQKSPSYGEDGERLNSPDTPSKTLSDFMGWSLAQEEDDNNNKRANFKGTKESRFKDTNEYKIPGKPANINTKRFSYLEKLENFSLRSPTARH